MALAGQAMSALERDSLGPEGQGQTGHTLKGCVLSCPPGPISVDAGTSRDNVPRCPSLSPCADSREGRGIDLVASSCIFIAATASIEPASRLQAVLRRADEARRTSSTPAQHEGRQAFDGTSILRITLITLGFHVEAQKPTVQIHGRRGFRARTASTSFTLVVGGVSGASALAKRLISPKCQAFPAKRPGWGGGRGKTTPWCGYRGILPISRRLFPQSFAATCCKSGRHW